MDTRTLTALIDAADREERGVMTAEEREAAVSAVSFARNEDDYRKAVDAVLFLKTMRSSILSSSSESLDLLFEGRYEDIPSEDWRVMSGLFASSADIKGIEASELEFPVISRELAETPVRMAAERKVVFEEMEIPGVPYDTAEETGDAGEDAETAEEERAEESADRSETEESYEDRVRNAMSDEEWTRLMYMFIQTREAGMDDEMAYQYGEIFRSTGASWEAVEELAADIGKELKEAGWTGEALTSGSVPENEVGDRFFSRFSDILKRPEAESAAEKAVKKAVLTYGSRGVESYLLTDSALEDMASFYVRDKRKLRTFTSPLFFGDDLKPDKGGIFSEELLGPIQHDENHKSQACMCGKCSRSDTDADAKAGFVCPECGYPVMSSDDRKTTYGLIESPYPLLMGRAGLVGMMLKDSRDEDDSFGCDIVRHKGTNGMSQERILGLLEKCDPHVFLENGRLMVYDTFVIEDEHKYKADTDEHYLVDRYVPGRVYGTEALEMLLRNIGRRTGKYNGKEYPQAVINAMENLRKTSSAVLSSKPGKNDSEDDKRFKKRALSEYNRALNWFSVIAATIMDRGAKPEDFLLHYIPVPPVATRPLNDRNSTSDYGEDNKLFSTLINKKNTVFASLRNGLLAGETVPDDVWYEREADFTADVNRLVSFARDSFYNKNGRLYRKLQSTKADDCIRAVITPTDNRRGQGWLRLESGGELDLPAMDLIGLPRSGLRVMYEKEIKAVLKRKGYSDEMIKREFDLAPGTKETTEDGMERYCLVDRTLDEVMLNRDPETGNARGRMVLYMRHPVITDGSVQAGYAYPVDHNSIELPTARCKAMNADFDGDTGLAVRIEAPDRDPDTGLVLTDEDKKAFMLKARAELKKHMDSTVLDKGSDDLLVGPRIESLYGLYKMTQPPEDYRFTDRVIVNREELGKLETKGTYAKGRLKAQESIFVNHVVDELDRSEIRGKMNTILTPGTVYGFRDGKPLTAEENIRLVEADGRIFAVTPVNDFIRVPRGSLITEKNILEPGEPLCRAAVPEVDWEEALKGLKNGQFVYNQPIMTTDGDMTTPGRLAVENIFGHRLPFGDSGFNSKNWEKILKEEIKHSGMEKAKKIISSLTHLGFKVTTLVGEGLKMGHLPSTEPIKHSEIYDASDYEKAHKRTFGHDDMKLYGCTLKPDLKTIKAMDMKIRSISNKRLEGESYFVRKGEEYAVTADGRTLAAEYDMELFRIKGNPGYTARDLVFEEADVREFIFTKNDRDRLRKDIRKLEDLEKAGRLTEEAREELESLRLGLADKEKALPKIWAPLHDRQKHLKATYVNEYRAERYEKKRAEKAKQIFRQLMHQKNNYVLDSIRAGVKGEDLAVSMVALGVTKDYAGAFMELVFGSGVHGYSGDMRIGSESAAVITGNKTLNVDIIGAIGNMLMAAMKGFKYEQGDCGTTEYRLHILGENEEEVKKLAQRLDGRTLADDIITPEGELLAKKGEYFTPSLVTDAYAKGVRKLSQRAADKCRCRGTCEACAGKMRGVIPDYGAELGFSAKNTLVAPFSQGTMSRAKAADGGKLENGADILMNLLSGAYMERTESWMNLKDFSEKFADTFYDSGKIKLKDLPPVFTELFAKALVYYVDKAGLAYTAYQAMKEGREPGSIPASRCFLNYDAGMLQDTDMSYMAKDRLSSKMGAFGGRGTAPAVKSSTMYREKFEKYRSVL